ncbi:ankyrin [Aaosphaeria arxii CBS 175.79]|uniref:Ankyrin n=1 Tax=Aaosphaeria arxii CBS 175.79 TaxID=1450172 RepID=A0A6A5XCV1_9PLEO|nr:ankyrin [Aaosphaeria arxii CBS 175.79]KAF2010822.1 ankyrin [Aaosphaeria arxii CBS 175.79]
MKALVKAAIRFMFAWDIFNNLISDESRYRGCMKSNALIAAIVADEPNMIEESLQRTGIDTVIRTRYFGDPLTAAAVFGTSETVQLVLRHQKTSGNKRFRHLRDIHALEAAAEAGRTEIIQTLLDAIEFEPSDFERAILAAVRSMEESVAMFLIDRRPTYPQLDRETRFWLSIARTVAESGCEIILENIMSALIHSLKDDDFALVIEDACRYGHKDMTCLLLSAFPAKTPDVLTGSLFWAGYLGDIGLVDVLLNHLNWDLNAQLKVLAGTVSGSQLETTDFASREAGSGARLRTFTDVVHYLLPDLPSPISYRAVMATQEYPSQPSTGRVQVPQEAVSLQKAILDGNLKEAVTIFCTYGNKHKQDDLRSFSGSFIAAARKNHPEILLYLCENRWPLLLSGSANSAAIIQVFTDRGWNVNDADPSVHCSRFGDYVGDEHLTRWLLRRGADPNSRGDMDISAISVAVQRTPSLPLLKLLLEKGGRVDKGQLLHFTVQRRQDDTLEVIELLLDLDCPMDTIMFDDDPQSRLLWGSGGLETPLHIAVRHNKVDIASFLLERGADATVKPRGGRTALEMAKSTRNDNMISLLSKYKLG